MRSQSYAQGEQMLKKMAKVFAAGLSVALVALLSGCGAQEEYTPALGDPQVSPPAIEQADTLKVGVNTEKSPLAGRGSQSIIGIDVDIAAALADQLGLKVQVEDVGTDADKALEEGTVDIVMGQESAEENGDFWHSAQYLPTGVVLFAKEGSNAKVPTGAVTPKVAAQISSKSAWAVTNAFGEDALVSTNDLATAFSDLSKGNVDFVASDAVIGMYAANLQDVPVEIVCLLDTASGYCVGVSSDNTELQQAIQSALETITANGVVSIIEDKWLGGSISLEGIEKVEASAPASAANAAEDAEEGEEAQNEETDSAGGSSSNTSNTSNTTNTSTSNSSSANTAR